MLCVFRSKAVNRTLDWGWTEIIFPHSELLAYKVYVLCEPLRKMSTAISGTLLNLTFAWKEMFFLDSSSYYFKKFIVLLSCYFKKKNIIFITRPPKKTKTMNGFDFGEVTKRAGEIGIREVCNLWEKFDFETKAREKYSGDLKSSRFKERVFSR